MRRIAFIALLAAGFSAMSSDAASPACHAQSGEYVVPLVELYTSEGCDSCPPADRWLSTRFAAGRGDVVALAFHVDYWDRLGWKDRFATPAFTQRQHDAMRANRATFVYTPQVLLQGRDFREWRSDASAPRIDSAHKQRAGTRVVADVSAEDRDVVVVRAGVTRPPGSREKAIVGFAYVDSGLVTQVKAGENRGARLVHDHVVRAFETQPLAPAQSTVRAALRRPVEAGAHPRVVVFVQQVDSGRVEQTLDVPLAGCL